MKNIIMSSKEIRALRILELIKTKKITAVKAAELNKVSDRTIRRWKARYNRHGLKGLLHGNRGKTSQRCLSDKEARKIIKLLHSLYFDCGPTFAAEHLRDDHDIKRDPKTIRKIMIEECLWIPKNKCQGYPKAVHRQWRERKACRGEMEQFDGSYHNWFEGRGRITESCLLISIDDATGDITEGQFVPHEGVLPVMGFWRQYIEDHGLPQSVYLDKFSTYKMSQRVAQENPDLRTQLQRAFQTLGVNLIFANSPQAKGRVERLFKTLQDRLVKELRLKNISTIEAANKFLKEKFIPGFNKKYSVPPQNNLDLHRKLSTKETLFLPEILCRLETRILMNDFTVSFKNQWYQILPTARIAIRPKDKVIIREYPNQTINLFIREKPVCFIPISKNKSALFIVKPQTLTVSGINKPDIFISR